MKQNLLARTATRNKLHNGVPVEIVPYDHQLIWAAVDRLTPELLKWGCGDH